MDVRYGMEEGIKLLRQATKTLKIPVFGSLLVIEPFPDNVDEWVKLALKLEEAGARMLELNFTLLEHPLDSSSEIVKAVREAVAIPVMPKLTPAMVDIASVAKKCEEAGASAISAINMYKNMCIPGCNIYDDGKPLHPGLKTQFFAGMCGSMLKPIAFRCVADIARSVKIPISGVGGILTFEDAIQMIMFGFMMSFMSTHLFQKFVKQ